MRSRRFEVSALAAALLLVPLGALQAASAPAAATATATATATASVLPGFEGWPTGVLEIRSKAGRQWFKVLAADTPDRQERGLMFVTRLPSEVGMVFPQSPPQVVRMWMKNTLIPLDMLFLGANHRVLYIRENAPVESLEIITTPELTASVLEIAGGESARRGIRVGDHVRVSGLPALKERRRTGAAAGKGLQTAPANSSTSGARPCRTHLQQSAHSSAAPRTGTGRRIPSRHALCRSRGTRTTN